MPRHWFHRSDVSTLLYVYRHGIGLWHNGRYRYNRHSRCNVRQITCVVTWLRNKLLRLRRRDSHMNERVLPYSISPFNRAIATLWNLFLSLLNFTSWISCTLSCCVVLYYSSRYTFVLFLKKTETLIDFIAGRAWDFACTNNKLRARETRVFMLL